MDIQAMTLEQLYEYRAQISSEISHREAYEKAEALRKVRELMQLHGLSAEDLAKKGGVATEKRAVAIKYQHPTDLSLTWTGRGRKPLWVQAHLDNGGTLEDLLVA